MIAYIIIAIFGTVIGNFLNVWINKILECRSCKSKVSYQYPLVELTNALLYILVYHYFGLSIFFIIYSILFSILLTVAVIDYGTMRIPNIIIMFGLAVGSFYLLVTSIYYKNIQIIFSGILGMLTGIAIIGGFMLLALMIFKEQGMGMGDLKLLSMIGLFIGSRYTIYTIFIAVILGGIYGLAKLKAGGKIPFGPFISAGAVIAIIWGDALVDTYFKLIGFN